MTVQQEIERLQEQYAKSVEVIALREFNARVKPFCKKYNLSFMAGNGTWCFWDKAHNQMMTEYYDVEIWRGAKLKELQDVSDLMDTDCGQSVLGEYMPDYKGE